MQSRAFIALAKWRDQISSLSLSYVFHASFCALLLAQLFLTINFFRYGFDQYSNSSRARLDDRVAAIKNVLQPDEIRLLLRDRPALPDNRTLVTSLLPYPPALNRPQTANFNEYRTCRRSFKNTNGASLEVCVGTLDRSGRYGKDFEQTGKFVYAVIGVRDMPLKAHSKGASPVRGDHISLSFELNGRRDAIAIVDQARTTGKGYRLAATPFLITGKGFYLPMPRSQCQLRLPSESPGLRIYICMLSHDALLTFGMTSKQWPPSARIRNEVIARAAVMRSQEGAGGLLPSAATFEVTEGKMEDLIGSPAISIDKLVRPQIDQGVEVCIYDAENLLWASDAGSCQRFDSKGKFLAPNKRAECDIWCVLAKSLFTRGNDLERGGFIDGPDSPIIMTRYNEQLAGEIWLRQNAFRATYLVILMLATGLVYAVVFRKVLRPIQQLSDNVEAATVDLTKRVIIPSSSPSDELGVLTRAFNALLARVTDVVDAEVNNLKMIGHDIRSPLQSLLAMPQSTDAYRQIKRIQNAIERFDASSGPREAFERADLVATREDLADFLSSLVANATEYRTFDDLRYVGPTSGVWVNCELTALEDVISHILNNGARHRKAGTEIVLTLSLELDKAVVDIDNEGPPIPAEMQEAIFEYGVTTQGPETTSLGQGLYAAKSFITTMGGTIDATNLSGGVRFRIVLSRSIVEKD